MKKRQSNVLPSGLIITWCCKRINKISSLKTSSPWRLVEANYVNRQGENQTTSENINLHSGTCSSVRLESLARRNEKRREKGSFWQIFIYILEFCFRFYVWLKFRPKAPRPAGQMSRRRATRDMYGGRGGSEVLLWAVSSSKDPADRMHSSWFPSLLGMKRNYRYTLYFLPTLLNCWLPHFVFRSPILKSKLFFFLKHR